MVDQYRQYHNKSLLLIGWHLFEKYEFFYCCTDMEILNQNKMNQIPNNRKYPDQNGSEYRLADGE